MIKFKQGIIVGFAWLISMSLQAQPIFNIAPVSPAANMLYQGQTTVATYLVTLSNAAPIPLNNNGVVNLPAGVFQLFGPGLCPLSFNLTPGSSCLLQLQIFADLMIGNIQGGPRVCNTASHPIYCSYPSPKHQLSIIKINTLPPTDFTALAVNPSSLNLTIGGIARRARVTNLSATAVQNLNVSIPSGSGITLNPGCTTCTDTLAGNATCDYSFAPGALPEVNTVVTINGSNTLGPVSVTITVSNPPLTTLTASISQLALATNGIARTITITNTGSEPALDVQYSPSPALPAGTIISPTQCNTINAGSSCILTITPGATPSAAPYDANPTPITLNIQGNNTNALLPSLNILDYGSFYQGGFIYSIDDTTSDAGSIGGKVLSLTDQAARFPNGVLWSSDHLGNVVFDFIYGIDETSTSTTPSPTNPPVLAACDGGYDGACNSSNIFLFYSPPLTNPAITLNLYASGRCQSFNGNGFNDWYLPSICEMGPDTGAGCIPGTHNILANLPLLIGDPVSMNPDTSCANGAYCLAGFYQSSTEYSVSPNIFAWSENFDSAGSSQFTAAKNILSGVRCARELTV